MSLWAAMDIGTNSTRLLVAEIQGERILPVKIDIFTTRLGKDVARTGVLSREGRAETLKALVNFQRQCRQAGVEQIRLVGTSAMRRGCNQKEFCAEIKKVIGLEPEVVSGTEEARLSFLGLVASLPLAGEGESLAIDIGGGSTELIWGQEGKPQVVESLPLGAISLTEAYLPGEGPYSHKQHDELRQHIYEVLKTEASAFNLLPSTALAIGSGGTVTNLAAIYLGLSTYSPTLTHGTVLPLSVLMEIQQRLASLNLAQRKIVTGLQPERADIITAGTIILTTVLERFQLPEIIVSEGDLLLGLLVDLRAKLVK
jgi:exopolyphosphatase/guanosine-5'-triphosphate,3'-diphosphate pyrophosphatase